MCRTMDLLEEIDDTTEESLLREINTLVVGKLKEIQRRKQLRAGFFFVIGQNVWFSNKNGFTERGRITKINPKTIKVSVIGELGVRATEWSVSPTMLHAEGE